MTTQLPIHHSQPPYTTLKFTQFIIHDQHTQCPNSPNSSFTNQHTQCPNIIHDQNTQHPNSPDSYKLNLVETNRSEVVVQYNQQQVGRFGFILWQAREDDCLVWEKLGKEMKMEENFGATRDRRYEWSYSWSYAHQLCIVSS